MNIQKIILSLTLAYLFVGCTNKEYIVIKNEDYIKNKNISENIETQAHIEKEAEKKNKIILSDKENEFLEILKTDKYASICNSQNKYLDVQNAIVREEKSALLNELFYEYVNNLNNSCIDKEALKITLNKKEYIEKKQFYEVYDKNIDKEKLLKLYKSTNISIKNILEKYTPKHPDFFKLIAKLDKERLSGTQYKRLRLNIERLKLLKDYNSENFIQLNIPSYNFSFYENNKIVKNFGTVVGSNKDQTPILSSKLSYFIVNPAWNIPDTIAKSTIIPNALKDKKYLKRKNIIIRKNYKLDSDKFNFKDVDWKPYLEKNVKYIPYKFIQLPSNTNGMGRVKYMFKNDYAVYMHDTIGTWRFKINKDKIRSVSHGCVRLEHPLSLMKYISTNYTSKSYKNVRKIYDSSETGSISLNKKLPIHITYITSYIKNGDIKFHNDIYDYDKIQKLNFNI